MQRTAVAFTVLFSCVLTATSLAQTTSRVQSRSRPFGLEIVDSVKIGGSDERSADFQSNNLPYFNQLINTTLSESTAITNVETMTLDPTKLTLQTDYQVRAYFVGEGAGYRNTLGFTTVDNQGNATSDPQLIFPDVSSPTSYYDPSSTKRYQRAPLLQGDFVDLGTITAGDTLDFFLIANGANGGRTVWTADESQNPDGLQHVVAYAQPGTPYLLIGFEDLYNGGDKDYNDALFVVDVGSTNVDQLTGAPEPSTWLVLFAAGVAGLVFVKQKGARSKCDG